MAKKGFYAKDGSALPAVTKILDRFKESGALIGWAWKVGRAGQTMRDYRDPAQAAGKIAHALIHAEGLGRHPVVPDAVQLGVTADQYAAALAQAQVGLDGFTTWASAVGFTVVASEVDMVSELHRYGARLDAVARLRAGGPEPELLVCDWKLASGVYLDHLLQLAAERQLAIENGHAVQPDGVLLLTIDKETGACSPTRWSAAVIEDAYQMFLRLRNAWAFDVRLQAVLKPVAERWQQVTRPGRWCWTPW